MGLMTEKDYLAIYENCGKPSRAAKKRVLGKKPSKKALKQRIKNLTYQNEMISDFFCPNCGCEAIKSSGPMAEWPEVWDESYCVRCGKLVSGFDNGLRYGPIYELLEVSK
ncbi:hypothetical protein C6370_18470 [Bacillus atrophaeus]|uniref:hypothetical protein n=1 Tax=Bacillus atrophaeus TaxID=1452 RepID=UPI000D05ED4C|nr:hypothetical protein [Bacillus atrophaeus]PSA91516.1 hypothetical protein C6370_18470 [Bacillus atrophaeus]